MSLAFYKGSLFKVYSVLQIEWIFKLSLVNFNYKNVSGKKFHKNVETSLQYLLPKMP